MGTPGCPRRSGDTHWVYLPSLLHPAWRGSPLILPQAQGSTGDPGDTSAALLCACCCQLQGWGVPEDLSAVPAMCTQPFLMLLHSNMVWSSASTAGLVTAPLFVVAMLVSTHPTPLHLPVAWWGWLRGTVALVQQHLVAAPFTPGGHAVQVVRGGGHVQHCQRAATPLWHIPHQDS